LYGTEDQKKKYLPEIASGEAIGSFALSEGNGTPKPHNLNSTFSDGKLNGEKAPVNDGEVSDFIIVAANTDANKNNKSLSLFIVDAKQDGVTSESLETIDPTRPSSRIILKNAEAELLGNSGDGWEIIQKIFERAAVLFAFEQVGGAQVALDEAKKIFLGKICIWKTNWSISSTQTQNGRYVCQN
jgi:alkylation response protein AidB-like acyl-CoA dehydrogenase